MKKKKPLCTVANAHCKPDNSSDECIPDESWITSIASLRSTDLLASGNTLACILFKQVLNHWRGGSKRTSSISHPSYNHKVFDSVPLSYRSHLECLSPSSMVGVAIHQVTSTNVWFLLFILHTLINFKTIRHLACQSEEAVLYYFSATRLQNLTDVILQCTSSFPRLAFHMLPKPIMLNSWGNNPATNDSIVTCLPILPAGSCDSCIKLWECGDGFRSLKQLFSIPMVRLVLISRHSWDSLVSAFKIETSIGLLQVCF